MIKATDLHKSYGELEILKGIDLEIKEGELIGIVGASGAGKSTLLHILGTLDRPDKGALHMDDKNVFGFRDKELSRFRNRNIGFVFQFHHLLPEFTAIENVCMPAWIAGLGKHDAMKSAGQWLERLGLKERQDHKPSELSGGEQQRVAVARALVNNPRLLLADEPSGNLDSENARELHEWFLRLKKEFGQTAVLVTHNQDLAGMADRALRIRDGKIEPSLPV